MDRIRFRGRLSEKVREGCLREGGREDSESVLNCGVWLGLVWIGVSGAIEKCY